MKHPTVLLLGGGGFIGRALAGHLCRTGGPVHVVGRNPVKNFEGGAVFHQGSMADRSLLESILPQCDVVIHLASATTPGSSAGRPLAEADTNILPTLKLLDMFRDCGNRWMIFVSSGGTLYGNPETVPVNESQPLCPLSYHGAGKIAIEAFLHAFAHDSGKHVTILRPANVYGPGQPLSQGFGFIRTVLEHARMDTEVKIWGDGSTVRDFLYIEDMIKGIESVMNADPHTDTYNIGSGEGHSLNNVIKTVEKVCGRPLKVQYSTARQVDVRKIVLDCSKIMEKTGWKPETSLEEGVRLTWQWMLHQ
ncbi:NAD-dependent epimerase/dehydratase family protein [Desulfosudis oleivorans]|uniref:NAD-dependent epimerase/dehydratase n=1 Tax=Desulfosudis oleivorans (strain DSM 6200 / JCM 39069 / Hxd3) TaxID=96561 RepID=A8ZU21_DESOH|nr:NAD-dependent epimerase/dehydratase family protein [Desulfosudis oleivorans]ABW66333.1 NAD-dependent epimerase/dehydratase [Desulfosudis oleivorans Hxd3]